MKTFHAKLKGIHKALSILPLVEPMPVPYYSPVLTKPFELELEKHIMNKSILNDFQWFESKSKKSNLVEPNVGVGNLVKRKDDLPVSNSVTVLIPNNEETREPVILDKLKIQT